MNKPEAIYWGRIEDVEAEVGLFNVDPDWLQQNRYTHVVKPVGADDWDAEFHTNRDAAQVGAREWGDYYEIPVHAL